MTHFYKQLLQILLKVRERKKIKEEEEEKTEEK